jgi:Fibronectin type III domain
MQLTAGGALRPLNGLFRAILVFLALLALLMTTSIAAVRPARAATTTTTLKAVLIVGPSGLDATNKSDADSVAAKAAGYGMAVTKVYTPHATWSAVLNNIQGANLVIYWGHGNGWPSPYGPYQENSKDGFGLNATDGSSTVQYYGGNYIRSYVNLAPNAIVGLSHACYTAGNGEPGMAMPTYDVARQRVDNFAASFLYAGARDVFGLETGSFTYVLDGLFLTTKTMDGIFSTPGSGGLAYYGFVGWNDKYFDSARMPGYKNHMDPESAAGYRRALTGNMSMTTVDWKSGAGGGGSGLPKPTVTAPRASFVAGTSGKSTVTVHLAWDASPSSGVTSYELQYSQDGGLWTGVSLGSPTALTANKALVPSSSYRFRLRATDSAGTVGDWVTSASRTLGKSQETSTLLAYSGTWTTPVYLAGASKSYVKKAYAAGDGVRYTFSGTDVGVVTTRGPARGMAQVWLDGTQVASLDLYAATVQTARVVWASGVSSGSHVLEVRVLGTKNALSTSRRVDVDAFIRWK